MTTDLLREARSALSACCADSEMSLDEWRENQDLIARIDAALAQPAASEPKVGVSAPYYPAMPQAFADYMAQQMPPGTVISEPLWWAPRIWRTAMRLYAAPQPVPPDISFPERDSTLPVEQQGVFRKFDVRRVDGSDQPGGKHFGCEYFVLDMAHDQYAKDAIRAYAEACKATYPTLSSDLLSRYVASQPTPPKGE